METKNKAQLPYNGKLAEWRGIIEDWREQVELEGYSMKRGIREARHPRNILAARLRREKRKAKDKRKLCDYLL